MTWGRSCSEPQDGYFVVFSRYKDGKPTCTCGRDVGRYGALFTAEIVDRSTGRCEGRCKRCYGGLPVRRQILGRIGRIYDDAASV